MASWELAMFFGGECEFHQVILFLFLIFIILLQAAVIYYLRRALQKARENNMQPQPEEEPQASQASHLPLQGPYPVPCLERHLVECRSCSTVLMLCI